MPSKSITIPYIIKQKLKAIESMVAPTGTSIVVTSDSPPEGYKEVTKIFVNLETGVLLVEHKL